MNNIENLEMTEKYSCDLSEYDDYQTAIKQLIKKVRKEWKEIRIKSKTPDFTSEEIITFYEAQECIFFVKDNERLYYCGPINVRNKGYSSWIFDYIFYLDHSYHVIYNISWFEYSMFRKYVPDEYICNPFVLLKNNNRKEVAKIKEIYDVADIQDIYIVEFGHHSDSILDNQFILSFYHNDLLQNKINVNDEFEISILFPDRIYLYDDCEKEYNVINYVTGEKYENSRYAESFYRCQEIEDFWKILCCRNSSKALERALQKRKMTVKQKELFDKRIPLQTPGYIELYFSVKNPIAEIIVEQYFSQNAEITRISPLFQEDFSHNYRIKINNNDKEIIYLWLYFFIKKMVTEPCVCGIEICKIIKWYGKNEKTTQDLINVEQILEEKISPDKKKIIEKWMITYPYKSMLSFDGEYMKYLNLPGEKPYEFVWNNLNSVRDKYTYVIQKLVSEGKISEKWKSEFSLYMLVKSYYDDAIFQYKSYWLQNQSLDIYIPNINLAIEYQGAQHFIAIDFFGGEEGLKENQRRDSVKRKKCNDNNIRLYEWKYTMEISDGNFIKVLKSYNLNIPPKRYVENVIDI